MASSTDVKDIMGSGREAPPADSPVTRDVLLSRAMPPPASGRASAAKPAVRQPQVKRPKGMARELWSLISADSETNTLVPTDTAYKQPKARLGPARVRQWRWTAFRNPARSDQLELRHWRRACDPPAEYSFAKFNKQPDVPDCTEEQLAASAALAQPGWTEAETLHLLDLMRRFHMRFVIVLDRWDSEQFGHRSLEDLKERFYGLSRALEAQRAAAAGKPPPRPSFVFDAEHERRRREQLGLLLARTREEAAEEERLRHELVRIEQRRQDREKKTVHLQRLISQADAAAASRRAETPGSRRSHQTGGGFGSSAGVGGSARKRAAATPSTLLEGGGGGLRFQEVRQVGASLRSARIRLPQLVGQKKARALDTCLEDLRVDANPIATEEVADEFNQLRSDILLYSELRTHLQALDYEFQTLKHRYEQLSGKACPVHWEPYRGRSIGGQAPSGPGTRNKGGAASTAAAAAAAVAAATTATPASAGAGASASSSGSPTGPLGGTPSPTRHKRQAAIGQEQMMKKLKTVGMGRYNIT